MSSIIPMLVYFRRKLIWFEGGIIAYQYLSGRLDIINRRQNGDGKLLASDHDFRDRIYLWRFDVALV